VDIITFKAHEFMHCLNELASVVPKKSSTYMVCKYVAVTFKDGQAILTGSNAKVQISIKTNVNHSGAPKNFLFQFDKVYAIAKRSKQCETVTFSIEESKKIQLQFNGINATYKLNSMSYKEFIWLKSEKLDHTDTLLCSKVHASIAKVTHIKEKKRDLDAVLKGVHLYIHDGDILAVNTDGHRLALHTHSETPELFTGNPVVIPDDAAEMLMKMCATYLDNEITLGYNDSAFKAVVEKTQIVFSLHGGRFPDLRKIVPDNQPYHAILDRKILASSLKTLGTIAADERFSRMSFDFGNDSITIKTENKLKEAGEVDMSVGGENSPIHIAVAHNYMTEAISSLEGDQVKLSYDEPNKPIKITEVGSEGHINVIMPMR
jgi:DNA polymerase-3 subunit beta